MANALTNAGGNGVAGDFDPLSIPVNTGTAYGTSSYATATGVAFADNMSVRRSVSKTNGTTFGQVVSVTQNLRFAYPTQDGDAPKLPGTRTAA